MNDEDGMREKALGRRRDLAVEGEGQDVKDGGEESGWEEGNITLRSHLCAFDILRLQVAACPACTHWSLQNTLTAP